MPAPPDFRLYHSNALDVLAGLLADELRTPAPGQSLLAPDVVLIPQVAMRRWLQATLAQAHGIAANLEFRTPGEFVRRALDANVAGEDEDFDADVLRWRLYAALRDPALLRAPALPQWRDYLGDGDPLKPWSLAGELAAVFEKYQAWRRDWLLGWEAGQAPRDPQALLWRHVAAGRRHRARRIDDYLRGFAGHDAPLPAGLPTRLFAFATLNVSPDVLRVLATQARVGTLHFYLPTPAKGPWGDLAARRTLPSPGDADENPLLRDWGAAGRDFMALLDSYEVVHPSGDIDACVDPEQGTDDGSLRDSLLQRLQADLFHRRARPAGALRSGVDATDPSLQLHACHTRLRELQVLHDRLRALLEDTRFDPPLQPREIAVLAPDIDPYLPYLGAVFDGQPGERIPYAVADASPLAGEPWADVFLRLLALPVARFGLEETLDLLASPPLAEAAGLTTADFDRVHGWLHAAGARWGLDAAHRARNGAPADDAYTWQFALDRLLLGHASGDDDAIAGVAPWAELEGNALTALDTLLRMLRVLARHERVLGEAMAPAQWRERLLDLLDALVPRPPATPGALRAVARLRALIDGFAQQAARAGFGAAVPSAAVRAHFAAVLGAADTRAPLLTGGVSFARMVPMRLLPFRVICLLGMNDGDFPRRDPAAGLNRLIGELGGERRRAGDRSTREDDRYLFLQLFAAAEDVFYVSWLGADPRDGSVREPSALVTELLAAAVAQHAGGETQPDAIADALVLRHPLQPFSPRAFGAGDARLFSYRTEWADAAAALGSTRRPLAPWIAANAALPVDEGGDDALSLDVLRRFLRDPADGFLRHRLDVRLARIEASGDDIEPLLEPARGLEQHALQRAVFDALLDGRGRSAMQAMLRARGLLPSGAAGRRALDAALRDVGPYAEAYMRWRGHAPALPRALDVEIDGVRVRGHFADALPHGVARLRFGVPNASSVIRNGLDWLLASAAGDGPQVVEFHEDENGGVGPHPRTPLDRERARDALRRLMALRAEGLRRPLPFAPRSAWALFSAPNIDRGVYKAAGVWRGSELSTAEADAPAWQLALRGRDLFADVATTREFVRLAGEVFGLLTIGAGVPLELDAAALPDTDDAEDAA